VPGIESEWTALTRDYQTLQVTYQGLLAKSETSAMAGDLEKRRISEQFRVLDPARVPVAPVGPLRLKINGVGFAVGLLLGLLLVAGLELLDTTFRSEGDVLDVLSLPVLATVPLVLTDEDRMRTRRKRQLVSVAVGVSTVGVVIVVVALQLWKHVV
jgi:hypothetical protein